MPTRKICTLGVSQSGISLSTVIAAKCSEIRVTVLQKNSDFVYHLNTGQIPSEIFVPDLEELMRKCQGRNLFFTTNREAIKEAEIIFIMSNSKLKTFGHGKGQIVDMSMIEDAACLIAEYADSDKIVVENSSIPFKTAECVNNILKRKGKPRVQFQVLSSPEFYEQGNSLRDFLSPDSVLIGCEDSPEGIAAAKQLANIYGRWISPQRIIVMNVWTTELSKICSYAMLAQTYVSFQSLSAICDETEGNVLVFKDVIGKDKKMGMKMPNSFLNVRKFPLAVRTLVYLYECYNLKKEADYWRGVLELLYFSRRRIFKNIIWKLSGSAANKRIALLGFAYNKNTEVSEGGVCVDMCSWFLDESTFVNIYDFRMTKERVIDALLSSGCENPVETMERMILVFNDPYKAVKGCEAIIVCCPFSEFANLDFSRIFQDMMKPAYIFDTVLILPHSKLLKIGFNVYAFGKVVNP